MKKLTLASLLIVSFFGSNLLLATNSAEALSFNPARLSISNITEVSMSVNLNENLYTSLLSSDTPFYLNYRLTRCGEDPATAPTERCAYDANASFTDGTKIVPFQYTGSSSIGSKLSPIFVSGLTPGAKYTLWVSYDNGIRCVTTPCPSVNHDFSWKEVRSTLMEDTTLRLTFSNITSNSLEVSVIPQTEDDRLRMKDRSQPIQIKYSNDSCVKNSFGYSCNPNIVDTKTASFEYSDYAPEGRLPIKLNNLTPNTRYVFYIGELPKNTGCVSNGFGLGINTNPCGFPIIWSRSSFEVTTLPQTNSTATKLTFSNISNNTTRVDLALGNDEYQQYVQNRENIGIRYIQNSFIPERSFGSNTIVPYMPTYQYKDFTYSSSVYGPVPITLNNLNPNTTYRVWLQYQPPWNCPTGSYCTLMVPQPIISTQSWTFTTTGNSQSGQLTEKLFRGVNSEQVRILQRFLIDKGYLMNSIADGKFGPKTHTAVVKFQASRGLFADGIVGKNTRYIINNWDFLTQTVDPILP